MTIFEDEVKTRTLSQNSAQYSAPALEKGLDIIELLSASENGLIQLSNETKMNGDKRAKMPTEKKPDQKTKVGRK